MALHLLSQDSQLLDRIRRGDEEALVTLHHRSRSAVIALVRRNSGSLPDAEDVLQEALVILWERVRTGRYTHDAKLETFVFATARNIWLRRLARLRREAPAALDDDVDASSEPNPLEQLMESEQARAVTDALSQLGDPCRTLLLLYYWEELSMEEIAERMGFANAATAKSKKYQCKKALQALLREFTPTHE